MKRWKQQNPPVKYLKVIAKSIAGMAIAGVLIAALPGATAAAAAGVGPVNVTSTTMWPDLPAYAGVRYVGANPKLSVTLARPDFELIVRPTATFEVWTATGQGSLIWASPASSTLSAYVPDGLLADGGAYKWRARGRDANYATQPYGAWSAWQYVTADLTDPAAPSISSAEYPDGVAAASGGPGQFTITTNSSGKDARAVCYRIDGQERQCNTGTLLGDGRRTLTLTMTPTERWHTIAAGTEDHAGNEGAAPLYEYGYLSGGSKVLGPNYSDYTPNPPSVPSPAPTPTGDPTSDPVVGGTFTLPSGSPAVGYTVRVYPIAEGEIYPIAEVTTDANGAWSATLNNLDQALQAEASANGGVLHVYANTFGKEANGSRPFLGTMDLKVGVAAAGILTEAAILAREATRFSAPLLPVWAASEMPPQPTEAQYNNSFAAKEIDSPTAASAADAPVEYYKFLSSTTNSIVPVNPMIIGNTNYTNVSLAPMSTGGAGGSGVSLMAGGSCTSATPSKSTKLSTTYAYTTVAESHAYYDVKGAASYKSAASTDFTIGVSYNLGSTWGASGSTLVSNSFSTAAGWERGPHYSHELDVPVRYERWRYEYCDGVSRTWQVASDKVYGRQVIAPSGWAAFKTGTDVYSMDGYTKWAASPYKTYIEPESYIEVESGKTRGFGWAANLYGFGVTATTNRSSSRSQKITSGTGAGRHDVFCPTNCWSSPKALYSY